MTPQSLTTHLYFFATLNTKQKPCKTTGNLEYKNNSFSSLLNLFRIQYKVSVSRQNHSHADLFPKPKDSET